MKECCKQWKEYSINYPKTKYCAECASPLEEKECDCPEDLDGSIMHHKECENYKSEKEFCTCDKPAVSISCPSQCRKCHLSIKPLSNEKEWCSCSNPLEAGEHFVNGVNNTKNIKIGDCLYCQKPLPKAKEIEKLNVSFLGLSNAAQDVTEATEDKINEIIDYIRRKHGDIF